MESEKNDEQTKEQLAIDEKLANIEYNAGTLQYIHNLFI